MMVRKGSKKKNPAIQLPDNFFAVLFMLAAFLCLFLRIRYIGLIGIQGVGYYTAACSWFLVLFAVIGAGMYSSVYHMTVSRMERMNEKGVIKTVRAALGCVFLCTFAFGGVAYILAEVFSTKIMKLPLMAMTYRAFLPSLFFISAVLIFAGALDGIGEKQTSKKIGFLFCFLLFLFAPIITEPLYTYGEKVGALLQNEMYGPAYGAMGAALSFLAVSVLMFLLSGIFWLKARPSGREVGYGLAAGKEHDRFMGSVLSNALPVLLPALIWTAAMLGELILFFRTAKTEPGETLLIWGGYAGKIRVLCMAGVLLVSAVAYHMMPQLKLCFSNRNLKKSRERCMVTVRLCVLTAIPCMVFLLICAPALTAGSAEEGAGAITAGLLQIGSLCLIFYGIAAAFGIVLYSMEMMKILVLDMAVSAVLHLIVLYGMLHFLDLNAYGLVYTNIIFSVLLSFCFLASVKRQLRLRINWLRMFLAPAVGGLVMAAVCAMLSNVLLKNAPALVNAIVSAAAGFLVYPLTIIVIKGISPKEMRALPAGERLLSMVRRFRLM